MVETAARELHLTVQRTEQKLMEGKRQDMHNLLLDMASTQLSPKLSLLCIPEWRAMEIAAKQLCEKVIAQTPQDPCQMSLDTLRDKAMECNMRAHLRLSKEDLLVKLCKDEEQETRPTLQLLLERVRAEGGQPRPCQGRQGNKVRETWDSKTCRRYLLQKRSLPELRELLPVTTKRQRKTKTEMIEELLKNDCIC